MHHARYCQRIDGDIIKVEAFNEDQEELIGTVQAWKLLIDISRETHLGVLGIIDYDSSTMNVAEHLIDIDTYDWYEEIENHEGPLLGSNLLILSRIEILPKFRGQGIGKRTIKDLYNNFIQGCGLFALKCFPLQCEVENKEKRKDKVKTKMEYEKFDADEKKAFKSLQKYYKSIGFHTIPSIDKSIMVINSGVANRNFKSIKLE